MMVAAALPGQRSTEIPREVRTHLPTVFVIDPDPGTGKIIKNLLQGHRLSVCAYASGNEFFADYVVDRPGCLVLEHWIGDIHGLEIQQRLDRQNRRLPAVYVASGMDISTAVLLMRGGAIHVLEKPLHEMELLNAIQEALVINKNERRKEAAKRRMRESIAMLTRKERQLVSLIASAKSTKAIAAELGTLPPAVELLRRRLADKLGSGSFIDLIRFAVLSSQEFHQYLDSAEAEKDGA